MEPTLDPGETLVADLSAYTSSNPNRYEVVIFDPPEGGGQWAFRVIGLPGETINFSGGTLIIDGKPPTLPNDLKFIYRRSPTPTSVSFPHVIPQNSYFVLGDNPAQANDSRYWGSLPKTKITGKILFE